MLIMMGLLLVAYVVADIWIDRAFRRSAVRLPATIIGTESLPRGPFGILPPRTVLEIEYVTPDGAQMSSKQQRIRRPVRGNDIEILYKPTGRARVRTTDALERNHWLKLSGAIALVVFGLLLAQT